jgi:hypothetical protein
LDPLKDFLRLEDCLTASRDLDRRIMLDVMGWKPWKDFYAEGPTGKTYYIGNDDDYEFPTFAPSFHMASAWEVVEKSKISFFTLEGKIEGGWFCSIAFIKPEREALGLGHAEAPTPALAICRAALKAVGSAT